MSIHLPSHSRPQAGFSYGAYYIAVAPHFDALRVDREPEIALTCETLARELSPGANVLEVGCGTARYGAFLGALGFRITGLDISQAQLEHAAGIDVTVCASSTAMPLSAGAFDACLAVMFLHQLSDSDRQLTLSECFRVLAPGGTLLIKTASHDDLRRRQFGRCFPSALGINLTRYPDIPILHEELLASGFVMESTVPTHTKDWVDTSDLVDRARRRHNTTLAMLPPDEFARGVDQLADALAGERTIAIEHWHTIVLARKQREA